MSQAEELLNSLSVEAQMTGISITPINEYLMIDPESRAIIVPTEELIFGVETDNDVERKHFKCPRIVGDNVDLSQLNLRVHYKNATGYIDYYTIDDVTVEDEYITFSWLLNKNVLLTDGTVYFAICAFNGDNEQEWNTTIATGKVLEGLEIATLTDEEEQYARDILQQHLNAIEQKADEAITRISYSVGMTNAKSHGIMGDGITDDAPAFSKLVSELNAQGGGTIYLPDGNYRLSHRITWKSNVSLVGESYNAVLKPYCDPSLTQGFAAISWLKKDGSGQGYNTDNPMINCHFRHFTIDGIDHSPANYDSYPKGINMHFVKDSSFRDIVFRNTYATGLGIDFLENTFIHNIYCEDCGRGYIPTDGEGINGGAGIGIGTMGMKKESCVISDCITVGCGNYGIFVEGGSVFPEGGCESYYTISNCQTIGGRNYGIAVKGTDNVMVSNNIMRNNTRDGFAILPRPNRACKNVHVTGNSAHDNGGCGYRLADGDNGSNISDGVYIKGNVSSNNTKDGVLVSSLAKNVFIEDNVIIGSARGIAIAERTFENLYINRNRIVGCDQPYAFKGTFVNDKMFDNQLVQFIGVHEVTYDNVFVDDSGKENTHDSSKTTRDFTYCKDTLYCGFYFETAYTQTSDENRICYCHWYDDNLNFISREGSTVNGKGWKRFSPPEGACYVKYRIGVNKGSLTHSQLKGVYLIKYMTDRC